MQHSHCSYCGTRYEGTDWPRLCGTCGETTWRNPLPVAVALLPVERDDKPAGLVVVRRDIEPFRGELALPGGFVEYGEDWRVATVRELWEETGITGDADEVRLFDAHSSPNGGTLMVFGLLPPRPADALPPVVATEEATEWLVAEEAITLAFSTHTQVMANYFASA